MAKTYHVGALKRLGNTWIRFLLRLGVPIRDTALLTTVGRKTGQRHTTPVNVLELEEVRWLVAPYGPVSWVHNARAAGRVTLTRGRRSEEVGIVEVPPEEAAPVLREYLRRVSIVRPYFDVTPDASTEAFVDEAPRHPVFRVGSA